MADQLDWRRLLNAQRRKGKAAGRAYTARLGEDRTEHERDHDRILFSTPVRRLQDKTQVFPLERNDSVRTRLTHSHEVANMARSMGTTLAFVHGGALGFPGEVEPLRNVPALLEAIGLAHDLGNPPFGHQGETAIQTWVKRHSVPRKDDPASFDIFDAPDLSEPMRRDFLKFEGNAQAFRLLTRLQILNDDFGLNGACQAVGDPPFTPGCHLLLPCHGIRLRSVPWLREAPGNAGAHRWRPGPRRHRGPGVRGDGRLSHVGRTPGPARAGSAAIAAVRRRLRPPPHRRPDRGAS